GQAVAFAHPDAEGLPIHRGLGAVLEDHPEPFPAVLTYSRLLVLRLADLGDEEHDAAEDEERALDDVLLPGERHELGLAGGELGVLGLEQVLELLEVLGDPPRRLVDVVRRALPGGKVGHVHESRVVGEQVEIVAVEEVVDRGRWLRGIEQSELIEVGEGFDLHVVCEDPVEPGPELALGNLPGGRARDTSVLTPELDDLEEGSLEPVARAHLLWFLGCVEQAVDVGVEECLQCCLEARRG
ncbi:hypothetical protein UN64_20215, partial [Fictibacillus arsenicus]